MFDATALKKTLSKTYAQFLQEYDAAAKASTLKLMASLAPGQPIPDYRLQSEEDRYAFMNTTSTYRDKAIAALQKARDDFDAEISVAPSTEAVNAISMLQLLSRPTEAELMAAHAKYGDNYLAHRALADLAAKHKYYGFPEDNVGELLEGFKTMERVISREFTVTAAEANPWGPEGRAALFDQTLESCFPE